jgi:hypothetical protein
MSIQVMIIWHWLIDHGFDPATFSYQQARALWAERRE